MKVARNYIKATWPRDDDGLVLDKYETERQVADKLGVGQKTVNSARKRLQNNSALTKIRTPATKSVNTTRAILMHPIGRSHETSMRRNPR